MLDVQQWPEKRLHSLYAHVMNLLLKCILFSFDFGVKYELTFFWFSGFDSDSVLNTVHIKTAGG